MKQLKVHLYVLSKGALARRHADALATGAFEESFGRQRKMSAPLADPPLARALTGHRFEDAVLDAIGTTDRIHRIGVGARSLTMVYHKR